jgi:hypothetical protein
MRAAVRPIFASLSAFALLGVVTAAGVGTRCHYDFSRQEMRSARGSITNVADHPAESKTSLRVIARDFMVVHLGQREFLSAREQGIRDMTNFSWCRQEVDGQDDLDGNVARLCATLTQPR